jgi:hypothetical protein
MGGRLHMQCARETSSRDQERAGRQLTKNLNFLIRKELCISDEGFGPDTKIVALFSTQTTAQIDDDVSKNFLRDPGHGPPPPTPPPRPRPAS